MEHLSLTAWPRITGHKGAINKDRADGFVPGILLGHHKEAISFKVRSGDLTRVLRKGGRNALVNLDMEGASTLAIVREFKRDPRSRHIIHLDLQRVKADEAIEAEIPVTLKGKPEGLQMGGVLIQEINAVLVKGIATQLPKYIEVDVSHLSAGQGVYVKDLLIPEDITVLTLPDQMVALVSMKLDKEETEEEAEVETEVETEETEAEASE